MRKKTILGHYGGEVPQETAPQSKYVVEDFTPLETSILWKFITNYYNKMAITAWSANYVPMFITSNSRLAKSYARIFINFLKDFYLTHPPESAPIYIIEIGAGHGRFTYLFLRHTLRTMPIWAQCNIPEHPFVYVYTDITQANINFCKQHPRFQEFIQNKLLDFAIFNANHDSSFNNLQLYLQIAEMPLPAGHPNVLIANYVLDSLLTDAIQIHPYKVDGKTKLVFKRSLVKVFSSVPETDLEDPDIVLRMSLQWWWAPFDVPKRLEELQLNKGSVKSLTSDAVLKETPKKIIPTHKQIAENETNLPCPEYLTSNQNILSVLEAYALKVLEDGYPLSFVLPLGAFRLFSFLYNFSGNQLVCIIGDKGYQDTSEFRTTTRNPHIAIHGAISFMVNLHSIRLFFRTLSGVSYHTPYKDTFQVIVGFLFRDVSSNNNLGHSRLNILMELEDIIPDTLMCWQRTIQNKTVSRKTMSSYELGKNVDPKTLLGLLRFSAHDADVFSNLFSDLNVLTTPASLGLRCEYDMQHDFELVFENWYKLRESEDIPDCLAQLSMKMGRLERALYFFEQSIIWCPEGRHPATYVNMASCYKALSELEKAEATLAIALELDQNFAPALDLEKEIKMCRNKLRVAFVGCGKWSINQVLPTLRKDPRISCTAFFTFQSAALSEIKDRIQPFVSENHFNEVLYYVGRTGFNQLLLNDAIDACVVDIHPRLQVTLITQLWNAGKHTFTLSPFCFSKNEALRALHQYVDLDESMPNMSESLISNVKLNRNVVASVACCYIHDEALEAASAWIKSHRLGDLLSVSYICLNEEGSLEGNDFPTATSYDAMDMLAVDLLNGLQGIRRLLPDFYLQAISSSYKQRAKSFNDNQECLAPSIAAWFSLKCTKNRNESNIVLGTSFCSSHVGNRLVKFTLHYSFGSLSLEKPDNIWTIALESSQERKQMKFPSDGLSNAYSSWISLINQHTSTDLVQELNKQKTPASLPNSGGDASSTCSTSATSPPASALILHTPPFTLLYDIVILECIFLSIQEGGTVIEFSHNAVESKEAVEF